MVQLQEKEAVSVGARRTHHRYELVEDRKVVYVGITDDPERREQEHRGEGKKFDRMRIVGPAVTEESAKKWEEDRLAQYRHNHGGRNPKYNETDQG